MQVSIDLTHQRMHVQINGGNYDWPVSTARSGFYTPGGSFAPTHLELMHSSRKYHMSPMPYAIFFHGGYAIHGIYSTGLSRQVRSDSVAGFVIHFPRSLRTSLRRKLGEELVSYRFG